MGFTKITNVSLTELFVQQIENMILSGELAVGEQLPPARELSVRMGVSRPVISAGLIELEKLGFIEIHPRQGAFVSDYRRKGTVETLVAIMRYNGGAMRDNEVTSLLQVRNSTPPTGSWPLWLPCCRQSRRQNYRKTLRMPYMLSIMNLPLSAAICCFLCCITPSNRRVCTYGPSPLKKRASRNCVTQKCGCIRRY